MAKGIWLDEHRFVSFSKVSGKLSEQIATRARSPDFYNLGMLLPNPDPILKAQGQDLKIYRELRSDAHVGGCVRRRKGAVKAMDWGVDREQAPSRVAKSIESIFADLELERIIGQALDAVLYGYQPLEVMWGKVGGLVVPVDVAAKPAEWFGYDDDNQLRFKTRANPLKGEELPPWKFLVARQEPTYANPYGFADLSMCFWPLTFKKGGVKFWLNFAEKYGTPWAIGKTPRGTQDRENDALADQLEQMVQDAIAVIPDDSSVEILEAAGKSASADLYERLVMYCRSEVSIALTGTNQTVEANSNKASASAGLEVADDIRDGDAGVVCDMLNTLIRWICERNWSSADRPVFSMWDQDARDKLQAGRDESVSRAGARFTNRYWERTYGYQPGDLVESTPAVSPQAVPGTEFAEAGRAPTWADQATATLAQAAAPAWQDILAAVRTIVDQVLARGGNLEDLRDELLGAFAGMPVDTLAKAMELGFTAAELAGATDVAEESAGED